MAWRLLRTLRIVALALLFLLAGLWARHYWPGERPAPPPSSPLVEQLPAATLADLQGNRHSLRDWPGRSLLINFWATWCAPCREEMPLLQALQDEKGAAGFQVIGIAMDEAPAVTRFITEGGISYPQLVGEQDVVALAESFGPAFVGLPFTVFAGPGGEVLGLRTGALHPAELREVVAAMADYAAGHADLATTRARLSAD